MGLILTIVIKIVIMIIIVFLLALSLTSLLNPTATLKEIFAHWRKTYKGESNHVPNKR